MTATVRPSSVTARWTCAIEAAPTEEVVVLPNNKNVIMAAEQAADHSSKLVRVDDYTLDIVTAEPNPTIATRLRAGTHSTCPAFRACAVALLGCNDVDEAIVLADLPADELDAFRTELAEHPATLRDRVRLVPASGTPLFARLPDQGAPHEIPCRRRLCSRPSQSRRKTDR